MGQGGNQVSKLDLGGANELPWPKGFKTGAKPDAYMTFLKFGGFRVTLRRFRRAEGANRCQNWY